ncbi:MAG: hypothetical protein ACR2OG_13515 [Gemmatimonadaceae bacterium]
MPSARKLVRLMAAALLAAAPGLTGAQGADPYMRGIELEQADKLPDAARAYREALRRTPGSLPAILGLERVLAQQGHTDSLLPVLDSAIAVQPRERGLRSVQLRAVHSLGDRDRLRAAFERWRRDWPRDVAPYREYAKLLIQDGDATAADSVLRRARGELGTSRGMEAELAQLQASAGAWALAAESWRAAMASQEYLAQAAVFSLMPTPAQARPAVRGALLAAPPSVPSRRIMAGLELAWGSPRDAWSVLRDLPRDSATLSAWLAFARRAEESEAWLSARDALGAAFAQTRSAEYAVRAAADALSGGDAASALALSRDATSLLDSATVASLLLTTEVRALSLLGRAAEAQTLLSSYDRHLRPDQRLRLTRALAWGWVKAGDIGRAEELLRGLGDPRSGGEAAAWIALFHGDLGAARRALTFSSESSPDLVVALALLARTKADSAPIVGRAFLALAQGDSARAATTFEEAAAALPDAASLLTAASARIRTARHEIPKAIALWREIALEHADAPEAPEAHLEWARALRRSGDERAAIERLEYLILTYPQSALLPQARRELDLARAAVPPTP